MVQPRWKNPLQKQLLPISNTKSAIHSAMLNDIAPSYKQILHHTRLKSGSMWKANGVSNW